MMRFLKHCEHCELYSKLVGKEAYNVNPKAAFFFYFKDPSHQDYNSLSRKEKKSSSSSLMIGGVPTSLWKLAKLNILRWGRFHLISALSVDLNYGLICNAISEWSLHEERRPMHKIRLWKKARPPKNSAMVTWHETGETRINLVQAQQELWQKQGVRCVPKCRILYVCFLTKNTTYFRGHHYICNTRAKAHKLNQNLICIFSFLLFFNIF